MEKQLSKEERCIAKWEKRIEKAKQGMKRWGNGYGQTYQLEIKIYEEVIKDLKRLSLNQQ